MTHRQFCSDRVKRPSLHTELSWTFLGLFHPFELVNHKKCQKDRPIILQIVLKADDTTQYDAIRYLILSTNVH